MLITGLWPGKKKATKKVANSFQIQNSEKNLHIGDMCSHFINARGEIFDETLDRRVIAASLPVIKAIRNKLLVASGIEKADIICATLMGGLADVLYIDAPTAAEVLKKSYENTEID